MHNYAFMLNEGNEIVENKKEEEARYFKLTAYKGDTQSIN